MVARLATALAFAGVATLAALTAGLLSAPVPDSTLTSAAVGLAFVLGACVAPRLSDAPSAGAAARRGVAWAVCAGSLLVPVSVVVFFALLFTIGHGWPRADFWISWSRELALIVLGAAAASPAGGLTGWALWKRGQREVGGYPYRAGHRSPLA